MEWFLPRWSSCSRRRRNPYQRVWAVHRGFEEGCRTLSRRVLVQLVDRLRHLVLELRRRSRLEFLARHTKGSGGLVDGEPTCSLQGCEVGEYEFGAALLLPLFRLFAHTKHPGTRREKQRRL